MISRPKQLARLIAGLCWGLVLVPATQPLRGKVTCEVLGGVAVQPEVHITWEALAPEFKVLSVRVLRNGEQIAELDGGATHFMEEPESGIHRYTVIAIIADDKGSEDLRSLGTCEIEFEPPDIGGFIRGDCNFDTHRDISDVVCILKALFTDDAEPRCAKSIDVDDTGILDLTDAVFLARFLFLGAERPPVPFLRCGENPTADELTCNEFSECFHPPLP